MSFVAENACMRLAFHILVLLDSHRYAGLPTLSVPSTQDAKDRVPDRASNDDKLALYGLFKQATVGDNTTNKPGFLDQKGEDLSVRTPIGPRQTRASVALCPLQAAPSGTRGPSRRAKTR